MKDVQATGESSSLLKRIPYPTLNMIFVPFSFFKYIFVLLDPDPDVIVREGFRYVGLS